jgi:hypothetical protein
LNAAKEHFPTGNIFPRGRLSLTVASQPKAITCRVPDLGRGAMFHTSSFWALADVGQ